MRQEVWKFQIKPGFQLIEMPTDAKPLHVARQRGIYYLWALVYPERKPSTRRFVFVGTGIDIQTEMPAGYELQHVGTCFHNPEGSLVFHVFEAI